MVTTADAVYHPIDNDGTTFWVKTTLNAPNGKVISIDLNHPERCLAAGGPERVLYLLHALPA